jgi:hypothetical protein
MELYDLIRNIEKRPAMYLGQSSVTHLAVFLSGYSFARRQLNIAQSEQEKQFSEFQDWIQQKFNVNANQPWDKIILFFAQDEQSALAQFFVLLHEFQQENHLSSPLETSIAS